MTAERVDMKSAKPGPMPLDREAWRKELHLSNFVNAYYEYRDLHSIGGLKRILLVGPGQGLEEVVLRWRGYDVETFDIDETFSPQHVGSVHDLSRFASRSFDAVVASHVLEHLPLPYLDPALKEIARVASFALIYLPVTGRHARVRVTPGFKGLDLSMIVDVYNWFDRPDGVTQRYMSGQHYWEVGRRGFKVRDLVRRFSTSFDVVRSYRNPDWLPSYNFVLRSRSA